MAVPFRPCRGVLRSLRPRTGNDAHQGAVATDAAADGAAAKSGDHSRSEQLTLDNCGLSGDHVAGRGDCVLDFGSGAANASAQSAGHQHLVF